MSTPISLSSNHQFELQGVTLLSNCGSRTPLWHSGNSVCLVKAMLLFNHFTLMEAEYFGNNGISCDLSGKLIVQRSWKDVDWDSFNQLFNNFERTCVAGDVKWRPILAATRLLKVKGFHLILLERLIDWQHPPNCVKTETLWGHMDVGPLVLVLSS